MAGVMDGRVSVSDVRTVRYGEPDWLRERVVDHGLSIDPGRRNSDVLYGGFPADGAVLGAVHDATVELDLHARQQDLPGPDPDRVTRFLDGMLDGTVPSHRLPRGGHVQDAVAGLARDHGVDASSLLDRAAYGRPVRDYLQDIGTHRAEGWNPLRGAGTVDTEAWLEDGGMRGRADLLVDGAPRELKVVARRDPSLPRDRDVYQAELYGAMAGADRAVVDYPVQGETVTVAVDADDVYDRALADVAALRGMARDLRERQADGLAERTGVPRRDDEPPAAYRDRAAEMAGDDITGIMMTVTRDAAHEVV